jgi:hypothetical protein
MAKTKKATSEVRFLAPGEGAPNALLADVEIPLGGVLDGMKLTGIRVWKRKDDGQLFVSFPGRSYETADGTKTWEYPRAVDGRGETAKAARQRILAAYEQQQAENAGKEVSEAK